MVDLGENNPLNGQLTLRLFGSDSVHFVLKVVSKQYALVCRQCNSVSSKFLKYIYKQSTIHACTFMAQLIINNKLSFFVQKF